MKEIGQQLKKAREAKNIELSEVSLSVKINSRILRAIEEWDEAHLPPKTFLRGFLYTYASFLGLDSDEILKAFYSEIGSTKPKPYLDSQQLQANKISEAQSSQLAAENARKSKLATSEDLNSVPTNTELSPKEKNKKNVTTHVKQTQPSTPHSSDKENLNGIQINSRNKTVTVVRNTLIIAILLGALIAINRKMNSYHSEGQITQEKTFEEVPISIPAESSPALDPINNSEIKDVVKPSSAAVANTTAGSVNEATSGSANDSGLKPAKNANFNKLNSQQNAPEQSSKSDNAPLAKALTGATPGPSIQQTAGASAGSAPSSGTVVSSGTSAAIVPTTQPTAQPTVKPAVKPANPNATSPPTPTITPDTTLPAKPELKPAVKPEAKPEAKPDAKPQTQPETKPIVKPELKSEVQPEVKPAIKPEAKREILIEALGPVTVEITFNGKTEKLTLAPDDVRTIRSTTAIKLKASNGGALNISKNGKDLGIPGNLGQSVEVEY